MIVLYAAGAILVCFTAIWIMAEILADTVGLVGYWRRESVKGNPERFKEME